MVLQWCSAAARFAHTTHRPSSIALIVRLFFSFLLSHFPFPCFLLLSVRSVKSQGRAGAGRCRHCIDSAAACAAHRPLCSYTLCSESEPASAHTTTHHQTKCLCVFAQPSAGATQRERVRVTCTHSHRRRRSAGARVRRGVCQEPSGGAEPGRVFVLFGCRRRVCAAPHRVAVACGHEWGRWRHQNRPLRLLF
jgi:hypothetical protein